MATTVTNKIIKIIQTKFCETESTPVSFATFSVTLRIIFIKFTANSFKSSEKYMQLYREFQI